MKLLTAFLILIHLPLLLSCRRDDCSTTVLNPNLDRFEFNFIISPEKRVYFVGDTIKFYSFIHIDSIFKIVPRNLDFASQITCTKIFPNNYVGAKGADKFAYKFVKGQEEFVTDSFILKNNITNFKYDKIGKLAEVEINLIPLDTGYFLWSPFSGGITIDADIKSCKDFIISDMNCINKDNNIGWMDSIVGQPTQADYLKKGYFFKVLLK